MTGDELQVFISSIMRTVELADERKAAIEVIDSNPYLKAWHWEKCACAGPFPPMDLCLAAVAESHMLILLLESDITANTRKEHELAVKRGIPDMIFVKVGTLPKKVQSYLKRHQRRATYLRFSNTNELRTMISDSVRHQILSAYRAQMQPRLGTQVSYSDAKGEARS